MPTVNRAVVVFRAVVVYFGYLAYYCLFWYSLSRVLKQTGLYNHGIVYTPAVILTLVLFLLQMVQMKAMKKYGRYTKWICKVIIHEKGFLHLPMFVFIILSIAPYGAILKHAYMAAAMRAGLIPYPNVTPINQIVVTTHATYLPINNTDATSEANLMTITPTTNLMLNLNHSFHNNATSSPIANMTGTPHAAPKVTQERVSCYDLSIKNFDFFVLQSVIPLLVISQLVFPFPTDSYTLSQNCVVALKLVESFDMMDLLSDVWCVVESGATLQFIYYFALGTAAMLLPISISLEDLAEELSQLSDDDVYRERKAILYLRIFKSIMTLICMDFLFFVIRITLMIEEQNIQNGYGFLIKEMFSSIFRSYYICCALKKVRPE